MSHDSQLIQHPLQCLPPAQPIIMHADNGAHAMPAAWPCGPKMCHVSVHRLHLEGWQIWMHAGPLPESWSASKLTNIEVSNNAFTSTLPASYANLQIDQIKLSHNAFHGTLPEQWSAWSGATILYVHNNKLSGELPASWGNGNFANLTNLDLSHCQFTGKSGQLLQIPSSMAPMSATQADALGLHAADIAYATTLDAYRLICPRKLLQQRSSTHNRIRQLGLSS